MIGSMEQAYNIRLKTARLDHFVLPNGKKIELVTAEGFGKHEGSQMVKIGDMQEGEEEFVHMDAAIPEELLEHAVTDESIQVKNLRRGNIVTHPNRLGLWVTADALLDAK